MRVFKLSFVVVVLFIWVGVSPLNPSSSKSLIGTQWPQSPVVTSHEELLDSASASVTTRRYLLNSSRSKFVARALSGGLLWFKGHDHLIAVREFTGEAEITPESITPASLQLTAKAASMVETRDVFTEPQKQIINKELREIVLLPDQYPNIIFKSSNVSGKAIGTNVYDLKIAGVLTLHGVSRPITIPARVTLTGNEMRAQGEFSVKRSDFKVKATSALHGMIRVRDKVKFEFDIVGQQR